jgi:hypothetical protein
MTLQLENIAGFGTILVAIFASYMRTKTKVDKLEQRLDDFLGNYDKMCPLRNGKAARIDERLSDIEKDVAVLTEKVITVMRIE